MAQERLAGEENESFWSSKIVKVAAVMALVGIGIAVTVNLLS